MKKKILLTGGSGFIGRNILESYLSQKYMFVSPSHAELNLIEDDTVNLFFKNTFFDIVIHSATKPGHRNAKDPTGIFYSDMRMFFNLLNHKKCYNKLIILGSGAIYDMRNYKPKVKENDYINHIPADEHGFYRYCCAKYIEHVKNIIELRIFGIFGKYEDYAIRFISNAICKVIFGLPITIKQNRMFDYIWIDDLMQVLEFCIDSTPIYNCYNITPHKSIELFDIAKKVLSYSKKNIPITVKEPGYGLEYSGDNKRLLNEMPNMNFTPINESIKKLYEWYNKNKEIIDVSQLYYDK